MKLYDVDVEVPANSAEVSGGADGEGVDIRGAAASVGGAVAVDDNAQDSGSGYYTVTNDGPGPNMVTNRHPELPGNHYIGLVL